GGEHRRVRGIAHGRLRPGGGHVSTGRPCGGGADSVTGGDAACIAAVVYGVGGVIPSTPMNWISDIATDVTASGFGDPVSLVGVGGWGGSEVSATRIRSLLIVAGGVEVMNRQSRAPPVSMVTGSRRRSLGK